MGIISEWEWGDSIHTQNGIAHAETQDIDSPVWMNWNDEP